MPVAELAPASGTQVFASAQVLNRRILIVKGGAAEAITMGYFGPGDLGTSDGQFRPTTITQVNNLPQIAFNLFLYPFYDRDDVEFRARNYLEWRPVFRMPPDALDLNLAREYRGMATENWIPFCSPMLIPVGVPITFKACCIGVQEVAIEVRVPLDPSPPINDAGDQGQDRLVVSITASQ